MIKTALIFAAGRGERLRPLTDLLPKPMCQVGGIPLIEHLVRQLAQAGITHIVVNHAYLGSHIRRHLGNGLAFNLDISYSPEPPGALETGGGIIQALPLLGADPFLTVSADIFTNYPFANLTLRKCYQAHLVLVPKQTHTPNGDFGLNAEHLITNNPKTHTFGNIACFHPSLFKDRHLRRFRLADFLRPLAEAQMISGEVYNGTWLDTGSIERLKQAEILYKKSVTHQVRHPERVFLREGPPAE
jgi:N-acetyl-alpha-D-muramate 1-phosphate uridylyltransferase